MSPGVSSFTSAVLRAKAENLRHGLQGVSLLVALCSLICLTGPAAHASTGRPLVTVYGAPSNCILGDVRAIENAGDGSLVVGSNVLAVERADSWNAIEVPGAYGFRALARANQAQDHRVWIGAIGAIGYIERSTAGKWSYVSLQGELARVGVPSVRDVWGVRALGRGAVWVTDDRILRWQPESNVPGASGIMEIWQRPGHSHLTLHGGGDEVFVYQEGTGLLRLTAAGDPTVLLPDTALPATPLTWMLPSASHAGETLLGAGEGAYVLRSTGHIEPLAELSDALHAALPTSAVRLDQHRIAIGTFKSGVLVATDGGAPVLRCTTAEGMPDRAVYALCSDGRRLWVASPSGVARIDDPGQVTLFDRQTDLDGGRPLKVFPASEGATIVTSAAVFALEGTKPENPSLRLALRPGTAFTDAAALDDVTWVAGLAGLWRATPAGLAQEYFSQTDVLRLCLPGRLGGGVLFIEGYAFRALVVSNRGEWISRDLGASIPDTPVVLLEGPDGDVWVSTMKEGVFRFRWDESSLRLHLKAQYRPGAGLPSQAGRIELTRLGDRMIAFSEREILELHSDGRSFRPIPEVAAYRGFAATPATDGSALWRVQAKAIGESGLSAVMSAEANAEGKITLTPVKVPGLDRVGAFSSMDVTSDQTGKTYWIGGAKGLLRVQAPQIQDSPPTVDVRKVSSADASPYFEFTTSATSDVTFFQTRLFGVDEDWLKPTSEPSRRFTRIAPGTYRMDVRAVDRFARLGPIASQSFVVKSPWWRTSGAFTGAAILALAGVVLVAQWRLARLKKLNRRLNQLVAERTREIELGSNAKSDFLASVSHEIRNPLNGLTGLLGLLKEERLDPRERELARSLKAVAGTLNQVFEDVLQFSKLEYGQTQVDARPFALRPLLEELVLLFSAQAKQAACTLRLRWPVELADGFRGDREKIKTIVANFVNNALKYAAGSPVEIRVEATAEAGGKTDLYVEVLDGGPGVPTEEQEFIFKKFIRGRRAQAGQIPGTGLGLATCRMLAKTMNGSVGVETRPEGGSMFYLKLLLHRESVSDAELSPGAVPAHPERERFLVVDDQSYNRTVLEGIALELGAECDVAATVAEAVELCRRNTYTVVLLDWNLSDGTGGDVAQAILAERSARRPLIFAVTADDTEKMRQRCHSMGLHGVVSKPYSASSLRHAIHTARQSVSTAGRSAQPNFAAAARPNNLDPQPLFNVAAFDHYARARGEPVNIARLAYLEALRTQMAQIEAALTAESPAALARTTHSLRGLAGVVGTTEVNRAAARLQDAVEHSAKPEWQSAWAELQEACRALEATLQAASPPASPHASLSREPLNVPRG